MADAAATADKAADKSAAFKSVNDKDVHADALKRYERGFNKERKNIDLAYEDLRFRAEEGQWDEQARQARNGRPILVVNKIPQFVRQVTGDMRQMRPAIKCVPVDDKAEQEIAEKILPGMLRYIENRSDAQGAYFGAADSQVIAGIGHLRVLTEYASENTFNQEIRIAAVEDGVSVVWDPDATLPTKEDAKWCFVPVDLSRASFEEQYPDESPDSLTQVPQFFRSWFSDDYVRIAEYWQKVPIKRTLALMPDGSIEDLTDAVDDEKSQALMAGARVEKRDGFKVVRHLMTASGILQTDDWPGPDIPIVPMIGEEVKIGRETIRHGIVRYLKDPQRVYNYAISTQTETVALQPKAPFIGTHTMFEDNQEDWERANDQMLPYLGYKPDPIAPQAKPERSQPPVASTGLTQLLEVAQADMNAVTGIYPAALGAQSNETSGKAILARQREGDTGTFVYIDNFARAVRRVGQICINLIPHVYDTARTLRIVGEDGKIDLLEINQQQLGEDGVTPITLNDVTVGAYDVVIEMGASYSTKREEARDGMQALMQALGPQFAAAISDLYVKQQDFPLADKIAKRLQLMLPPQIQQLEAQESGEPAPPMPPQPPSPEMVQMQQEGQIKSAQMQVEMHKLQVEMAKVEAELEKARLDHQAAMTGHQISALQATQPQQANDPRVDQLAATVNQLKEAVSQIAEMIAQPHEVEQANPNAPPGESAPPPNIQPPPGGFSNSAPMSA